MQRVGFSAQRAFWKQSWHWRLQSFDDRPCPHAEAFPLDERIQPTRFWSLSWGPAPIVVGGVQPWPTWRNLFLGKLLGNKALKGIMDNVKHYKKGQRWKNRWFIMPTSWSQHLCYLHYRVVSWLCDHITFIVYEEEKPPKIPYKWVTKNTEDKVYRHAYTH